MDTGVIEDLERDWPGKKLRRSLRNRTLFEYGKHEG